MLMIELNKNEYEYLSHASFLNEKFKDLFLLTEKHEDRYLMEISENQADEIRDLCGEQLQIVGFDEKYELTSEGQILESLIDKLFIG